MRKKFGGKKQLILSDYQHCSSGLSHAFRCTRDIIFQSIHIFQKSLELQVRKCKYRFKWTSNSILTQDRSSNRSNFKSVLFRTNVSNKTNNGLLGDNLTPHDLLEYRLWLDGMWKDNYWQKNSFRKENHSFDWPKSGKECGWNVSSHFLGRSVAWRDKNSCEGDQALGDSSTGFLPLTKGLENCIGTVGHLLTYSTRQFNTGLTVKLTESFNPLSLNSGQHQLSPNNIHT